MADDLHESEKRWEWRGGSVTCQLIVGTGDYYIITKDLISRIFLAFASISGTGVQAFILRHYIRRNMRLVIDLDIQSPIPEQVIRIIGESIANEESILHQRHDLKGIFSGSILHILSQRSSWEKHLPSRQGLLLRRGHEMLAASDETTSGENHLGLIHSRDINPSQPEIHPASSRFRLGLFNLGGIQILGTSQYQNLSVEVQPKTQLDSLAKRMVISTENFRDINVLIRPRDLRITCHQSAFFESDSQGMGLDYTSTPPEGNHPGSVPRNLQDDPNDQSTFELTLVSCECTHLSCGDNTISLHTQTSPSPDSEALSPKWRESSVTSEVHSNILGETISHVHETLRIQTFDIVFVGSLIDHKVDLQLWKTEMIGIHPFARAIDLTSSKLPTIVVERPYQKSKHTETVKSNPGRMSVISSHIMVELTEMNDAVVVPAVVIEEVVVDTVASSSQTEIHLLDTSVQANETRFDVNGIFEKDSQTEGLPRTNLVMGTLYQIAINSDTTDSGPNKKDNAERDGIYVIRKKAAKLWDSDAD